MGTELPQKNRHGPHTIFGPCLLWPNGWMDQDATWYGGKPRPRRRCVRWGRSSPPLEGACTAPVFGSCLFWPIGWMDENATWYRSRPQPRPHCVRRGSSSPAKGPSSHPLFGHGRPSQLMLGSCLHNSAQSVPKLYNAALLAPLRITISHGRI